MNNAGCLICPNSIPTPVSVIEGTFLLDVKVDMLGHQFLINKFTRILIFKVNKSPTYLGFSRFTHYRKSIYYGVNINQ